MARILPIFLPFASCGNKCIFCDQQAISGVNPSGDLINLAETQLKKWLDISSEWEEIAFFGGNFSAIDKKTRLQFYKMAYDTGVKKIRFSTRPDTINEETLSEIKEYNIWLVELGIQSLDDLVLKSNGRPYTSKEAIKAVENVLNITNCGIQLMTGMYMQSYLSSVKDAELLSKMGVATARIYPELVLKNTQLEKYRQMGIYKPTEMKDIIMASAGMYVHLMSENINVIRIGLPEDAENSGEVTAGARHEAFGDLVKTFVMMLYMNMGGRVSFSGYKGICRKTFPEMYVKENVKYNMNDICRQVREYYKKDESNYFNGAAFEFAGILSDTANK